MSIDQNDERRRSALTTLSTVGAAVAGVGVGALLGRSLQPLAWAIVAIGVVSHLIGMLGVRRLLLTGGYVPPAWQNVAYWLCWTAIAAIVAAALWGTVR